MDNREFPAIFLLLFSATVAQLFVPCAIGSKLTEKVTKKLLNIILKYLSKYFLRFTKNSFEFPGISDQ